MTVELPERGRPCYGYTNALGERLSVHRLDSGQYVLLGHYDTLGPAPVTLDEGTQAWLRGMLLLVEGEGEWDDGG